MSKLKFFVFFATILFVAFVMTSCIKSDNHFQNASSEFSALKNQVNNAKEAANKQENSPTVINSGGVIIYKSNKSSDSKGGFGPADMVFDLPMR